MTFAYLASRDELQTWIGSAMNANELGTELNFAIIDEVSQLAVGTTSFYRVVPEHKRLELGKDLARSTLSEDTDQYLQRSI
jgi:hypothetical protein